MEKVTLGRIINVVGLQGEIKIQSLSHFSSLRYRKKAKIFIEKNHQYIPFTVKRYRQQGIFDFVMLEEIPNRTEAEALKNLYVFAHKHEVVLEPGSYFYGDLVGCNVLDQHGTTIGIVTKVEEHGTQTHLRIERPDQKSLLLPFIAQFIKEVHIENKTIHIETLEGLL